MNSKGNYAVAVYIESPRGIPLVRDFKKFRPFWKLPGGRSEEGETAENVAVREIMEEVGLVIKEQDLELLFKEDRKNHFFILFRVKLPSLMGLKTIGNGQEEVRIFSLGNIKSKKDFFPNHRRILRQLKML